MPESIFEYRIVETAEGFFMPQRGIPEGSDAIVSRFVWRDAVPEAAPSLEVAGAYVNSLKTFDARQSDGRVVWKTPTAP